MDEFLGHSRNFWLISIASFMCIFLFSFLVLPKVFFIVVESRSQTQVKEVDYHADLQFNLNQQKKMTEMQNIFSDVYGSQTFKKINIVVTDVPQSQKIHWMDSDGTLVNHLGFDVIEEGVNLNIYLYNNTVAFSHWGWDVEKIARENELLLIKALMYYRGWPIDKVNEEAKKVFLSLHQHYPEPLFLMTYDF